MQSLIFFNAMLFVVWTPAYLLTTVLSFNSGPISHLTTCPHADPLTALTMTQPYVFLDPCMACPVTDAVPLWWRCWCLPSPSTCLSKISAGSFLCPLILGFKTAKGQAADRKNSHESPRGTRHATHTPDPICQSRSCHDITATHSKNKSFLGLAIVGLSLMDDIWVAEETCPFTRRFTGLIPCSSEWVHITVSLSKTLNFMLFREHHSWLNIFTSQILSLSLKRSV